MKKALGVAVVCAIAGIANTPAMATVFDFSISTARDMASGQFTVTDGTSTVIGVSGFANGTTITGLSGYGSSDNQLQASQPYVDRAGLAFSAGGIDFNIFDNYTNSAGNPVYSFCNSNFDGGCAGGSANAAPVATFSLTTAAAAVPEPASWAMMIVGFGLIGAGMRYRQRRTVLRYI